MDYLIIRGLKKTFERGRVVAVDDLNLEVQHGEIVALLGPSGCGKTTTLRCVAGLEKPDDGEVEIGGTVVFAGQEGINVPTEERQLGMVFQSYAVWPHMTVFQNVGYPLSIKRVGHRQIQASVERALQLVGLTGLEQRYPSQLSGGQQQRVALARAIVGEPKALLFDEPLSNLDAKLRAKMRFELLELQKKLKYTSVYVTHDQLEAMVIAGRILVMSQGKIMQVGSPRDIYERPANEFVADFIGTTNFIPGVVLSEAHETRSIIGTDVGEIHIGRTCDVSKGTLVSTAIRAECIVLQAERSEGLPNQCEGVVRDVGFVGQRQQYLVETSESNYLMRVDAPADAYFSSGDKVWLRFPPEACMIFAER